MPIEQIAGMAQQKEQDVKNNLIGLFMMAKGAIGAKKDKKRMNALFKEREDNPFVTPKQVYDAYNFSQFDMQSGLGQGVESFMTDEANRSLSSSLDAATRLGGDPNVVASLADSYMNDIFSIGNQSEMARFKKSANFYNSLATLADNKRAEFLYKDNLRKDKLQAEAASFAANQGTLNSGINFVTGANAASQTQQLWQQPPPERDYISGLTPPPQTAVAPGVYPELNTSLTGTISNQPRRLADFIPQDSTLRLIR